MNRRASTFLAAALLLLPLAAAAQTFLINRIVLRINDRIATLVDFQRQLVDRRQAIMAAQDLDDARRQELLQNAGRVVLAEMYEELLLLSRADQVGARVTTVELDEAVANMRQRMRLEGDEEFQESLRTAGLTEEALRDRLGKNLLVEEVIHTEIRAKITFEEEELRKVWRENQEAFSVPAAVRLQDIVVLSEGRDQATVAATARQVHGEVAGGAAMDEVGRRWAAEGKTTELVDLGWVEQGDLDPALEAAAWKLPVGGTTQPVAGRGGMHLLRVVERREPSVRPFEEVKDAIESRERQRRTAAKYGSYLRELESQAHIAMQIPPEAEGFKGLADAGPELQVPQTAGEAAAAAAAAEVAAQPDEDEAPADEPPAAPEATPPPGDGG